MPKDEQVIFQITKVGEVEGQGYLMNAFADDRYIGGIAAAIASYAVQCGQFYGAMLDALENIKKSR